MWNRVGERDYPANLRIYFWTRTSLTLPYFPPHFSHTLFFWQTIHHLVITTSLLSSTPSPYTLDEFFSYLTTSFSFILSFIYFLSLSFFFFLLLNTTSIKSTSYKTITGIIFKRSDQDRRQSVIPERDFSTILGLTAFSGWPTERLSWSLRLFR